MYSFSICTFLLSQSRNTSKALDIFDDEKRSHIAIWNWIQKFSQYPVYKKRKRISAFIIDETVIPNGWKHYHICG